MLRQGRLVIDEGEVDGGAISLSRLRTVRLLPGTSVDEPLVFAIKAQHGPRHVPGPRRIGGCSAHGVCPGHRTCIGKRHPQPRGGRGRAGRPGRQRDSGGQPGQRRHSSGRYTAPFPSMTSCSAASSCAVLLGPFSDRAEGTLDELLGDVAYATKAGFEAAGVAGVTLVDGGVTVPPDAARTVRLRIDVPEHLRTATCDVGSMPVGTVYLRLLIVPHHRPGTAMATVPVVATGERRRPAVSGGPWSRRPAGRKRRCQPKRRCRPTRRCRPKKRCRPRRRCRSGKAHANDAT